MRVSRPAWYKGLLKNKRTPARWQTLIAAVVYALLVLWMWGSFAFTSGMPHETAFPHMSDLAGTSWRGFLYLADTSRIHTSTFYHLAHLIADFAGVPGSFVPYQIVYAILWWARGFLVFAILRRLFPGQALLSYAIGALCLVHATDGAIQWVGQMNQVGFIFWMLLAFFFFVAAIQSAAPAMAAVCVLLAGLFEHMSLWSYESQLLLVLVFPILILALHRPVSRRSWVIAAAWYVVPAKYISVVAMRYLQSGGVTYQSTVIRRDWSVSALLDDWIYSGRISLTMARWYNAPSDVTRDQALLLAAGAAATFVAGGALLARLSAPGLPDPRAARKILAGGAVLLILSFPLYLLLADVRGLWRTQMLSGAGAAAVAGSAIALVTGLLPRRTGRLAFWGLGAAVVCYASYCAVMYGGFHRNVWTRHRRTMAAVVRAAPQVRPRTMFVLTGVPKEAELFSANDWFDMALRLSYPGISVAGVYFHAGHSPGRNVNQRLANNQWKWDGRPLAPLLRDARLEETIALEYTADGGVRVLRELPAFLCAECSAERYRPLDRIAGTVPSAKAVNRYGPL